MTHNSKVSSRSSGSTPLLDRSEYQYIGRLVTKERPIIRKSHFSYERYLIPRKSKAEYYYDSSSSDDEIEDLSKPLGVIRINDRHIREIYRIPTPPPEIKRVYHRLRSPKTKTIERVYVHRPPPEIIENIIEIPPEKVRIINREKHLRPSKPIIRTKVVHLQPADDPPLIEIPQSVASPNYYPSLIPVEATCYTYDPTSIPSNYYHSG